MNIFLGDNSAQKRFGEAKAISSDDFFRKAELADDGGSIASRFRDATAISSADIHGEEGGEILLFLLELEVRDSY